MELLINDAGTRTNAGVWFQHHLDGFLDSLVVQGYSPATIAVYGRLVQAQCSELTARGLEVASLEAGAATTLGDLAPEGSAAKTRELWKAAARRFVKYLCELGVLNPSVPEDARESDDLRHLRAAYEDWLRHQRGLSDKSVKNNLQVFNAFPTAYHRRTWSPFSCQSAPIAGPVRSAPRHRGCAIFCVFCTGAARFRSLLSIRYRALGADP